MNTLEISVTVNGELYTKHKGDFNCVRKYDQCSGEDFILSIDFEIDSKKSEFQNKNELKEAVISHINAYAIACAVDNDFNNQEMVF